MDPVGRQVGWMRLKRFRVGPIGCQMGWVRTGEVQGGVIKVITKSDMVKIFVFLFY